MAVVAELEAIITADTSDFDAAMGQASNTLNEFGQSAGKSSDKMMAAGGMMAAAGAAITAPLVGAVKAAADFEYAMDGVNAALGGVDTATMELLNEQAKELGANSQFSATEIAGVQQELAKSGVTAQELLDGATKAVTDLAAATGEQLLPSTNLVASALNSFGLEGKDATRVADIFTTAMNESSMSTAQLQQGLNYLGPVLSNQNRYLEMTAQGLNGEEEALIDASAALAVFNQRGLKGADVGNSLARMYTELADPTSAASDAMATYGIEAFDAQRNLKALPEVLDEIGEALTGLSDEERQKAISDIFGEESKDVVEQMVAAFQKGGIGDEMRDIADAMHEEGIAAEQAEIRQDNLTGSVEKLGGALNNLAIEMGEPLLDPIKAVTDGVADLTDVIAGAPDPLKAWVSEFAALGGGLLTFGGLGLMAAGQALRLGETFRKAGLSLPLFSAGLLGIGAALGAGLLAYETNFMGFGDFVDTAMRNAGQSVETFGRVFDEAFNEDKVAGLSDLAAATAAFGVAMDTAFGTHIAGQTRKLAEAMEHFGDAFSISKRIADQAGFNEIAGDISALGHALDAVLGTDVSPFFDKLADAAQVFGTEWEDARKNGLDPFTSALLGARDAIGELAGVNLEPIFADLGSALRSGIDGVGAFKDSLLAGDWETAWGQLTGGLETVGMKFEEIDLGGLLQDAGAGLQDAFGNLSDLLFGEFDSMAGPGERGQEGLFNQLADTLAGGFQQLPALIGEKLEGKNPFEAMGNWIEEQSADEGILTTIKNSATEFGTNAAQNIQEGLDFGIRTAGADTMGGPGERGEAGTTGRIVTEMLDGWSGQISTALEDYTRTTPEVYNMAGQVGGDLGKGIGDALVAGMLGTGKEIPPGLSKEAAEVIGAGRTLSFGDSFANFDTQFTNALKDAILPEMDEAQAGTEQVLKDAAGDFWDDINTGNIFMPDAGDPSEWTSKKGGIAPPKWGDLPSILGKQLGEAMGLEPGQGLLQKIWEDVIDPVAGAAGKEGAQGGDFGRVLGESFGEAITGEKFAKEFSQALKQAPNEAFTAIGGAFLEQIGRGMATAMEEAGPESESNKVNAAGQGMGQKMVGTLAKGLTDALLVEGAAETFVPVANALGTALNTALGTAMAEGTASAGDQQGRVGEDATGGIGENLVRSLATGMTNSITAAPPELFLPMASALGTQLGAALSTGLAGVPATSEQIARGETGKAAQQLGGAGLGLVQGLATGMTESIAAAPPELFTPMATALGTQLGAAMSTAFETTQAPGPTGVPTTVPGAGESLVAGLATGLTNSITAAPPELFTPVGQALATQLATGLNTAMTQAPSAGSAQMPGGMTGTGETTGGGLGQQMVASLATGLTDAVTAAPIETFLPVSQALGTQLAGAFEVAMQAAPSAMMVPGGMTGTGESSMGGLGQQMVNSLATGLTTSVTDAAPETFQPVGNALGAQLGTALQTAMDTAPSDAGGMVGEAAAGGIGANMVQSLATGLTDSVTAAGEEMFAPVGEAVGSQLGTSLQTAMTEGDIGTQMGQSITDSLSTAVEGADFSGIGEEIGSKLTEALDQAISEASSKIGESVQQIVDEIKSALEGIGEAVSTATEEVSSAVEDMSSAIADATAEVSSAVEEMSASVEEAASAMEEAASSAAEAASEIGTAAAEAAEAVATAMDAMAASVAAAAGAIEAAAGQIIAALDSIAAAAGAAGAAIGSALAAGAGASLGIGSPSKVFMEIGEHVVEGLVIGMNNTPILGRGMNEFGKASIEEMGKAIGMGSPAKKFRPLGAAISDGMMAGMLDQAKGRMQSAMGKMSGAVESGMGKVKSAMEGAMGRIRSAGAQEATAAGAAAGAATAEGMEGEEESVAKATRRLWRRALKELLKGKGAMRFLGESWGREFWEGMLDSGGSLAYAQYVTEQIVNAAEDAITKAMGKVKGLAVQLEIVAESIETLKDDLESLTKELKSIDEQLAERSRQASLDAAREELRLQQAITKELEDRFQLQFDAAHAAHIKAVQTKSVVDQADYESALRIATATNIARLESKAKEDSLTAQLKALEDAIAEERRLRDEALLAELKARRDAVAEEIAMKTAQLATEMAMHADLLAAQIAAQVAYTEAVIKESEKRIQQLKKERAQAHGPEAKAAAKAEIALEKQRADLAEDLALALAAQATASDPEAMAAATAQVKYLTDQIEALGEVDVTTLLSEIVTTLEEAAGSMDSAATAMSDAATAMGSADATEPLAKTSKALSDTATAAGGAAGGLQDMGAKAQEVYAKMQQDAAQFQLEFQAMVQKTQGDAAAGGEAIGTSLSTGITDKIAQGAPALQSTMVQSLQGGVEQTDQEAETGATRIADTFGGAMRDQLGVELPKVHQDILTGMQQATGAAANEAAQGGKEVANQYGNQALSQLKQDESKFQTAMGQGVQKGINDSTQIASKGGNDVGGAMASGIQNGIQSQANSIANSAAQTVKDAIKAAHAAAGNASPSKRMHEVGDLMGEGLVLGLEGKRRDARDAAKALVYIPALSPTSDGGVTGRRVGVTSGNTIINIEHLELPSVTDPESFIQAMTTYTQATGVAAGRS